MQERVFFMQYSEPANQQKFEDKPSLARSDYSVAANAVAYEDVRIFMSIHIRCSDPTSEQGVFAPSPKKPFFLKKKKKKKKKKTTKKKKQTKNKQKTNKKQKTKK
jgi:hypothetical protein